MMILLFYLSIQMESVIKQSSKTVEQYRHSIKLLKYHLKKQQKMSETLQYQQAKKNKKQTVRQASKIQQKNNVYSMLAIVNQLNARTKEMGMSLGDLFRMADYGYEGEITREQFMNTIARIKANIDEMMINQVFNAIDTDLNGHLSSDEYDQFLWAHGGCLNKEAIKFQKRSAEKFAAALKRKGTKMSDFLKKTIDPCPAQDMSSKLSQLKLNVNESMILLKMWDPSLSGLIRHQVYLKSMETVREINQKQIQNENFEKGVQELCIIFRDRKINPLVLFDECQADGNLGISINELEDGLKKLLPGQTTYQIKKWVKIININGDSQITREEFLSSLKSLFSIQEINKFRTQYDNLHPKLQKALKQTEIPAEQIIDELSKTIEDRGLTKAEAFQAIDINHNGLVDKEELFQGLKNMGINIGTIGGVLTVFDRDASGDISLEEWFSILGADLQMDEIPLPTKPGKQKEPAKKKEKKMTKVQKTVDQERGSSVSPPKQSQVVKKQVTRKKQVADKTSEIIKKSSPLKDQDKNKTLKNSEAAKKAGVAQSQNKTVEKPAKVQQSKPSGKKLIQSKQSTKPEVTQESSNKNKKESKTIKSSKKKFAEDEQVESKKKLEEPSVADLVEEEGNSEALEREIAELYGKQKKRVLGEFKAISKKKKTLKNEGELSLCLGKLGLGTNYGDKDVKAIFQGNTSASGFEYQAWLQSLLERYNIQAAQEVQEEQKEPVKKKGKEKKYDELPFQSKNNISEEPVEEQSKAIENQSNVKEREKRGHDNEEFSDVLKVLIENQKYTEEGYKFSNFIADQEQLAKKQKYLEKAEKIKAKKKIYKDTEFPASGHSLTGLTPFESQIENVSLLKWKHYSQLFKQPKLFQKGIEPNDICQGSLGDCYFLCSLASLAEYEKLIERMFEYFDIENGYFLIWLCIDGLWQLIELDGYIPVRPDGKAAVFSRCKEGQEELWVILLQKAYAKAYGCYEHIVGGQPYEAIKDLTGAPGQSFSHKNKEITIDFLWDKLKLANQSKFIMTCGTDNSQQSNIKLDEHSQSVTTEGIVIGHAYSILDLAVYKDQRLIQLRNPWGNMEWKGDWSDRSKKWTPDAKKTLKYNQSGEDGIFWMPFESFFLKFGTTAINYIRPNYYYCSEKKAKIKNMVVKVNSSSLKHGFMMVAQEDHRKKGLPPNTPYNVCHCIVMAYRNQKILKKLSDQKYMYLRQASFQLNSAETEKGSEFIILINLEEQTDVNLCTYGNVKFEYEVDDNFNIMLDYMQALAKEEAGAKNVQTTADNKLKIWLASVGGYAFQVFRNITKTQLTVNVTFKNPNNLTIYGEKVQSLTIKPQSADSIKGKIMNMKQPYGFGQFGMSYQ